MAGLVQSAWSGDAGEDPASLTWDVGPTDGNVSIAVVQERSGGDHANHSIAGYTKRFGLNTEQANASFRRSLSIWTKELGAGESSTLSADDGTTNGKWLFAAEFELEAGETTWDFIDAIAVGNGATSNATSLDIGDIDLSGSSGDSLLFGFLGRRNGSLSVAPTQYTWAGEALTQGAEYGDTVGGASDNAMYATFGYDGAFTGTAATTDSTASYDTGDDANTGLHGAILALDLAAGGASTILPFMMAYH